MCDHRDCRDCCSACCCCSCREDCDCRNCVPMNCVPMNCVPMNCVLTPAPRDPYAPLHIPMSDHWQPVAASDLLRWPLINKALRLPVKAAYYTKQEWLVDPSNGAVPEGSRRYTSDYNYQQIFRLPWNEAHTNTTVASMRYGSPVSMKAGEKLKDLLDNIEEQMRSGERYCNPSSTYPCKSFGSVISLINRWPQATDEVSFSVLRDLVLICTRKSERLDIDETVFEYEYIIELTVMAVRREKA